MFAKLIVVSILVGLIGLGVNISVQQVEFARNIAKTIGTMLEVNEIKKIIYLDFVIHSRDMTVVSNATWSEYIRERMHSDDPTRDTSKDLWCTPYDVIASRSRAVSGRESYTVRSAGPDREHNTGDDIVAVGRVE